MSWHSLIFKDQDMVFNRTRIKQIDERLKAITREMVDPKTPLSEIRYLKAEARQLNKEKERLNK